MDAHLFTGLGIILPLIFLFSLCPVQCLHIRLHLILTIYVFVRKLQYFPLCDSWARCASVHPQGREDQALQVGEEPG